jgi:hypothetical protein
VARTGSDEPSADFSLARGHRSKNPPFQGSPGAALDPAAPRAVAVDRSLADAGDRFTGFGLTEPATRINDGIDVVPVGPSIASESLHFFRPL